MIRRVAGCAALSGLAGLVLGAADPPVEIVQVNRQFIPAELTVPVGATVVFANRDAVTHNVYSRSAGNSFNLNTQKPDESGSVQFLAPGIVDVRCAIHPKMRVVVTVRE